MEGIWPGGGVDKGLSQEGRSDGGGCDGNEIDEGTIFKGGDQVLLDGSVCV